MYNEIQQCRANGGSNLESVMTLGVQAMSGLFPKANQEVEYAPLDLLWCETSQLLQLRHSCNPSEMYGNNYGYRSGLNGSMVTHLHKKAERLSKYLNPHDIVLDIGSNDGTLLSRYEKGTKVGIDPTGEKFRNYYPPDITLIPDFFSQSLYKDKIGAKAKVITSISMFYDLPDPISFAREVGQCLADDGIWHLEQSYLPSMLRQGSYDTICHEHLEYYSLTAIKKIIEAAGLHIHNVSLNDVNGGSFAIDVGHNKPKDTLEIDWLLDEEKNMHMRDAIFDFAVRAEDHRMSLYSLISRLSEKKKIVAYGASTKGNVILQYCGIGSNIISHVAEINRDKFGCFTPGSNIPIVSESEVHAMKPDYMLVLPWHFKSGIIKREREYLNNGGKLIFPFPYVEVIGQ